MIRMNTDDVDDASEWWREIQIWPKDKYNCGLDVVVCESLTDLRDTSIELPYKYSSFGTMPLCHHALLRVEHGNLRVGETVCHIGSLEQLRDLRISTVLEAWFIHSDDEGLQSHTVDRFKENPEIGRVECVRLSNQGPLHEVINVCWCCKKAFTSTANVNHAEHRGDEVEYCDKCAAVWRDIALKVHG